MIYQGDLRPCIQPCVMASSAMGSKLGFFGVLPTTHAKNAKQKVSVIFGLYACLSSCSDGSRCRWQIPPHFVTFPPSIYNFPPSFLKFPYSFPSFLLHFTPFFLASFFPIGQQKFPGQKSWGALCPTTPPPPPPVTPLGGGIWMCILTIFPFQPPFP